MKIILTGYTGHMGREVRACAERMENCEIVAGVDPMIPASEGICVKTFAECTTEADVIIDFSHHSMTKDLLDFASACARFNLFSSTSTGGAPTIETVKEFIASRK